MRRARRSPAPLAHPLVAILALALACSSVACNGDDGGSSDTADTSSTSATATSGTSVGSGTTAGGDACPPGEFPDVTEHPASVAAFTSASAAALLCDETAAQARTTLDELAASVGLPPGANPAEIAAAVQAYVAAYTSGSTSFAFAPAPCTFDLDELDAFASACDPGAAPVACSGSCPIDPVDADACAGELLCHAPAAGAPCEGLCTGACELEVPASCAGDCHGACSGSCTVIDDQGDCAGACDGMCLGTCELPIGGSCSGACVGECIYTPPDGTCEGETHCAGAAVETCTGPCDGAPAPGPIDACCADSVEAAGLLAGACATPPVYFGWQFFGGLDMAAQAEFIAWTNGLEAQLGTLLATQERSERGLQAVEKLLATIQGPLPACTQDDICTETNAPIAVELLATAGARCTQTIAEVVEVVAGVGG